jgi:hypothetical protein
LKHTPATRRYRICESFELALKTLDFCHVSHMVRRKFDIPSSPPPATFFSVTLVADATVSAFHLAVVVQTIFIRWQPGSNMVLSGNLGVLRNTKCRRLLFLIPSVALVVCYSEVLAPADESAKAHSLSALTMKSPEYS